MIRAILVTLMYLIGVASLALGAFPIAGLLFVIWAICRMESGYQRPIEITIYQEPASQAQSWRSHPSGLKIIDGGAE